MNTNKVITKYLAKYAEELSPWMADFPSQCQFERCVIIPAFDEPLTFTDHFRANTPSDTLIILVLNCAKDCLPSQRQDTLQAKNHLLDHGEVIWQSSQECSQECSQESPPAETLQLVTTPAPATVSESARTQHWLIWDITQWQQDDSQEEAITNRRQIPTFKHGVGYARKLGMDCALQLFHHQQITNPFFLTTDADAHLPNDYFLQPNLPYLDDDVAGYIFPFRHQASDKHENPAKQTTNPAASLPGQLYEISLRYYVLGLRWANSPWGFHSVGSTLAIHGAHYAANRGFPKREAGEDFYLLNKIAKTGAIVSLKAPTIYLSDRPSHRVPFGTGPAIQRIQSLESIADHFTLYHPEIFQWLKHWQSVIPKLYDQPLETALNNVILHAINGDERSENIHTNILDILRRLRIENAISHSRKQSKSINEFCRHMFTWFDAFKTLKFIHYARDHYLPSLPTNQWIEWTENNHIPFLVHPEERLLEGDLTSKIQQLSSLILEIEQHTLPHVSAPS
ncbi:MAG: hypothetical protein COA99_00660 [Moraxellaceae bacterium]|nr:MAG: hypothetical protein COA99_00660 [Moraxellaceae bacterium]